MSMNSFLRRHQKSIFAATLSVFFGGMFVGFGGYYFTDRDLEGVVARVGKEKISQTKLAVRVSQYADRLRQQGVELDDAKMNVLRRELLNGILVDEMLSIKADELGLKVTDEELARDIRAIPAFARSGQFQQDAYFLAVRQIFRESPQDFERDRRKALKSARVKSMFYRVAKVMPSELKDEYAAANKGELKNFEKDKAAFGQRLQQQRALDLVNQCLRQMQGQVEVKIMLDSAESGA